MSKHTLAVKLSGKVDRAAGVIHGVSVITKGTAKGHGVQVDDKTLAQIEASAKTYAGGLKVVAGHTKPADSPFSATGFLKNFYRDGDSLRADLHVMKSDPNREKLFDMAEEMPDTFGLSVAFSGEDEMVGGMPMARCNEIYNAALVDWPAANPTGLFSAKEIDAVASDSMTPEDIKSAVAAAVKAELDTRLVEFGGRIKAVEDAAKALAPTTELAALRGELKTLSGELEKAKTELSAKIGDDAKRIELAAQTVAKEFAGAMGKTSVRADGAGNGGGAANEPSKADKFDEKLTKHFAAEKSKTRAWHLASGEDPEGYQAFLASGRKPSFEKKA